MISSPVAISRVNGVTSLAMAVQKQRGDVAQFFSQDPSSLADEADRENRGSPEKRRMCGVVMQYRDELAIGVRGKQCQMLRIVRSSLEWYWLRNLT